MLPQADQEIGDHGDDHRDQHGILGGAEKAFDLEVLLDPFEKQFDLPALLVQIGNRLGGAVEVVGDEDQPLVILSPVDDPA